MPLFPWFGAVLTGIAVARMAMSAGLVSRMAAWGPGTWSKPLQLLGRHSLAFYLIHQLVLIGGLWLASQVFPPEPRAPEVGFRYACEATCKQSRDEVFCSRYCACMLDELGASGDLPKVMASEDNQALRDRVSGFAGMCSARTESDSLEDPAP